MNRFALLLTFVAATASGQSAISASCLPSLEYQPQIVADPANRVTFYCDQATRMDLIRAAGFQTRLPLGVVLGRDNQALSRKVDHYELDRVDAKAALLQALDGTGYSLREDAGVLVMIAGDLSRRQSSSLSHAFFDFKPGENQSLVELGSNLTMWLGAAADPKRSYMASVSGSTNDERFTVHVAPGATTEGIADEIVRQGSKGLWVLNVGPLSSEAAKDEIVIEPYQHYSNSPLPRR